MVAILKAMYSVAASGTFIIGYTQDAAQNECATIRPEIPHKL